MAVFLGVKCRIYGFYFRQRKKQIGKTYDTLTNRKKCITASIINTQRQFSADRKFHTSTADRGQPHRERQADQLVHENNKQTDKNINVYCKQIFTYTTIYHI